MQIETQHLLIGLITGFSVSVVVETLRTLAGRQKSECGKDCRCGCAK
jgi:hypothetical protein